MVVAVVDWSRSMVARVSFTLSSTNLTRIRQASSTSQTRQSRLLPFVSGVQPPSWPRRHRLSMDESTRSRMLLSAGLDFQEVCLAVRGHLTLSFLNLHCNGSRFGPPFLWDGHGLRVGSMSSMVAVCAILCHRAVI